VRGIACGDCGQSYVYFPMLLLVVFVVVGLFVNCQFNSEFFRCLKQGEIESAKKDVCRVLGWVIM